MKTLVIFYSYSGNTKAIAQKFASAEKADIVEIQDENRPGMPKTIFAGILASIRGKSWPIKNPSVDLTYYDKLVLYAPIWAGNVPPVVNSLLEKFPAGKAVAVKLVSKSGASRCKARLESLFAARNCRLESYEDIKA